MKVGLGENSVSGTKEGVLFKTLLFLPEKEPELTFLSKDKPNENPKLEELACLLDKAYCYNPQTHTLFSWLRQEP